MFFIFGWNHQNNKAYGPVEQHLCPNCHNTEFWQLNKISKWFTLFFIPLFSHESHYFLTCPICNNGFELDNENFEIYKSIAEINSAFLERRITDDEKNKQLEEYYTQLNQNNESKKVKHLEESKNFQTQVMTKTDDELLNILNGNRSDNNPAFIIAVEEEIKNRRINNN